MPPDTLTRSATLRLNDPTLLRQQCYIDGRWSDADSGATRRLTPRTPDSTAPRPEACVFSPDGSQVAHVRPVTRDGQTWNQVFVCRLPV